MVKYFYKIKRGFFMKKFTCIALLFVTILSAIFVFGCDAAKRPTYYNIKFFADGEQVHTFKSAGNEVIEFPADPKKTDYRFEGWFLDDGTWQQPLTPDSYADKDLNKNLNVYAKFTARTYSTEISIEGFTKSGNTYSGEIASDVDAFYFNNIVAAEPDAKVTFYYNNSLSLKVPVSYFELNEGYTRSFYVKVENGEQTAVYTVTITRRQSVTVNFYVGSNKYHTTKVDKGQLITDIPADPADSVYDGYFSGWDYDFSKPVSENSLTITAIFDKHKELAGFYYTKSGSNYFKITSLRNSSMTDVVIPDSVNEIGERAFYMKGNIKSLHIGKNVQSIGQYAFYDCHGLESITVDSENRYFRAVNNCLIRTSENYIILGCDNSVIPEMNVNGIDEYAFYNCDGITSVNIPAMVNYIGTNAFGLCSGIESITVNSANSSFTGSGNCLINNNGTLVLGCKNSVIPTAKVNTIGTYAFYGCTGLTSLNVPENITQINNYSFAYCKNLASMSFAPGSKYYVDGNCVIDRTTKTLTVGLKNAVIPVDDSVTVIGECAFMGRDIESIVIPASITTIKGSAFFDCQNLNTVYYEGPAAAYNRISIEFYNDSLDNATKYYYNETQTTGNCWHYVGGVPTKW